MSNSYLLEDSQFEYEINNEGDSDENYNEELEFYLKKINIIYKIKELFDILVKFKQCNYIIYDPYLFNYIDINNFSAWIINNNPKVKKILESQVNKECG